jgi:hypothetical protein
MYSKSSHATVGLSLFALMLSACSGGAEPQPSSGESARNTPSVTAQDAETTRVLHTVAISDSHQVDFVEFGLGLVGVRERMDVDDKTSPLFANSNGEDHSLADLYQMAKPGSAVPSELLEADQRADAEKTRLKALLGEQPEASAENLEHVAQRAQQQYEGGETLGSSRQALAACSGDFYGDNWGAQWFIDYFGQIDYNVYCSYKNNKNQIITKHAVKNWTSVGNQAHFWIANTYGISWHQMEGDYNNYGPSYATLTGNGIPDHCPANGQLCTGWRQLWNDNVPPRKVYVWYVSQGISAWRIDIYAGNACNHMHSSMTYCVPK